MNTDTIYDCKKGKVAYGYASKALDKKIERKKRKIKKPASLNNETGL